MSNETAAASSNGGASDVPEIELIIKASTIDGRRKGACLFCQEYFMDLYLLAELKTISLKVTTVVSLPNFFFVYIFTLTIFASCMPNIIHIHRTKKKNVWVVKLGLSSSRLVRV